MQAAGRRGDDDGCLAHAVAGLYRCPRAGIDIDRDAVLDMYPDTGYHHRVKVITIATLSAFVTLASCLYLDRPVALFIRKHALHNSMLTRDLPDLLLMAVLVTTFLLWLCYLYRYNRGIDDKLTDFFRLAAWTVPSAFILKSILKPLFGRVSTRFWLDHQAEPDFVWFFGGEWHNGFPSGHMAVFTAFLVSVCLIYPRYRPVCLVILVLLGTALMATNYHFLGDVLGGAWLGVMVNFPVAWLLGKFREKKRSLDSTPGF